MSSALTYISVRGGIPNTMPLSGWTQSQNPLSQPHPDFSFDSRYLLQSKLFSISSSESELESESESESEYRSSPES